MLDSPPHRQHVPWVCLGGLIPAVRYNDIKANILFRNCEDVTRVTWRRCHSNEVGGRGGGIRLIVGFQPLMVISPTARWIRWWAERFTPDSFWVPSHRFNSATGEQKGITQTIYTDPEPPSPLPNSLMPSAKLRSANLPVFTSLV